VYDIKVNISQIEKRILYHYQSYSIFKKIIETCSHDLNKKPNPRNGFHEAVFLANKFGIKTVMKSPVDSFSWDGEFLAIDTDTAVIFHEIAHWQLASQSRRRIPDFGLGASPETGHVLLANKLKCLDDNKAQFEEYLASLLGIIWEASFGLEAIYSLIEQNWLELPEREFTSDLFIQTIKELKRRSLISDSGDPIKPS